MRADDSRPPFRFNVQSGSLSATQVTAIAAMADFHFCGPGYEYSPGYSLPYSYHLPCAYCADNTNPGFYFVQYFDGSIVLMPAARLDNLLKSSYGNFDSVPFPSVIDSAPCENLGPKSKSSKQKRLATVRKKKAWRKKRKHELGRQPKLSSYKTIRRVRMQGKNGELKTKNSVGNELVKEHHHRLVEGNREQSPFAELLSLVRENTRRLEQFRNVCEAYKKQSKVNYSDSGEKAEVTNEVQVFDEISQRKEIRLTDEQGVDSVGNELLEIEDVIASNPCPEYLDKREVRWFEECPLRDNTYWIGELQLNEATNMEERMSVEDQLFDKSPKRAKKISHEILILQYEVESNHSTLSDYFKFDSAGKRIYELICGDYEAHLVHNDGDVPENKNDNTEVPIVEFRNTGMLAM